MADESVFDKIEAFHKEYDPKFGGSYPFEESSSLGLTRDNPKYLKLIENVQTDQVRLRLDVETTHKMLFQELEIVKEYNRIMEDKICNIDSRLVVQERDLIKIIEERINKNLSFRNRDFLVPLTMSIIGLVSIYIGIVKDIRHFTQIGLIALFIPALDILSRLISDIKKK